MKGKKFIKFLPFIGGAAGVAYVLYSVNKEIDRLKKIEYKVKEIRIDTSFKEITFYIYVDIINPSELQFTLIKHPEFKLLLNGEEISTDNTKSVLEIKGKGNNELFFEFNVSMSKLISILPQKASDIVSVIRKEKTIKEVLSKDKIEVKGNFTAIIKLFKYFGEHYIKYVHQEKFYYKGVLGDFLK